MKARKAKHGWLLTLIFSVISVLYMYPIVLVFINSFKKKAYISRYPFKIPKGNMFVGGKTIFVVWKRQDFSMRFYGPYLLPCARWL